MKRGIIMGLLGMAVAAGLSFSAYGEAKDNPYQVIIDRNPFGLRPIPPPEPPKKEEPPPEPPPDINLTGITTLLGTPKVFLQLKDKKKGTPTFPSPMAVGDTDYGITVLSIDPENLTVRIKNGEVESTLNFKDNGVKPGAGAVAAAVPGVNPGFPNPAGLPVPTPAAPVPNLGAANTGARGAIVAGGSAMATPPAPVAPVNPAVYNAAAAGIGNLPQRPLRTDNNLSIIAGGGNQIYNPNPTPNLSAQPTMTKEEAEARIEATRRILEQRGDAAARIMPPTSLGHAAGVGVK